MTRPLRLTVEMVRAAAKTLTLRQSIVVVAHLLGQDCADGRVCLADLVVRCHEIFPDRFGLHGRSSVPCSNKVYSKLAGFDGVCERGKGWLAREGDNYTVTVTRLGHTLIRHVMQKADAERCEPVPAQCEPAPPVAAARCEPSPARAASSAPPRGPRRGPRPAAPPAAPPPRWPVVTPVSPKATLRMTAETAIQRQGADALVRCAVVEVPPDAVKAHLWEATGPVVSIVRSPHGAHVELRAADLLWNGVSVGTWPGHPPPRNPCPPQSGSQIYARARGRTDASRRM